MSHPASTNSSRLRQIANVNPKLDKGLAAYIVAAGAAGVGVLASSLPAQARVVYTPDNQQIGGGLSLSLRHNGIADFVISNFYSSTSSTLALSIGPVNPSNEIFSTGSNRLSVFAAALPAGVPIGPNGKFKKRLGEGMANGIDLNGTCQGPWIHAHNQYLGLKFMINGEVHFGWARLNVNCVYPKPIRGTLTGYAYETVANQSIVAGDTNGPDVSVGPGTLGNLARGAAAISNSAISNSKDKQITNQTH
jgi:hypothetical protein